MQVLLRGIFVGALACLVVGCAQLPQNVAMPKPPSEGPDTSKADARADARYGLGADDA